MAHPLLLMSSDASNTSKERRASTPRPLLRSTLPPHIVNLLQFLHEKCPRPQEVNPADALVAATLPESSQYSQPRRQRVQRPIPKSFRRASPNTTNSTRDYISVYWKCKSCPRMHIDRVLEAQYIESLLEPPLDVGPCLTTSCEVYTTDGGARIERRPFEAQQCVFERMESVRSASSESSGDYDDEEGMEAGNEVDEDESGAEAARNEEEEDTNEKDEDENGKDKTRVASNECGGTSMDDSSDETISDNNDHDNARPPSPTPLKRPSSSSPPTPAPQKSKSNTKITIKLDNGNKLTEVRVSVSR